VGLVTVNTPTETVSETYLGQSISSVSGGSGGSGFGYQFGAGIKYNFTERLGFTVNVAYTGSSISYTGYTGSEAGYGGGAYSYTNTTLKSTMSLGLLTATVGIALNL
jgi:hypothetical protein